MTQEPFVFVVERLRREADRAWRADDPFRLGYEQALRDVEALAKVGTAAPGAWPACVTHGDPLVCLACEADEDQTWKERGYATPPSPGAPAWATTDAPGLCRRGHAERQPKCPACHFMRIAAYHASQAPSPGAGPGEPLLTIAGLVNAYHNDGTTLTAAETLRAIADALGDPFATPRAGGVERLVAKWRVRAKAWRLEGNSVSWWSRLDGQARAAEQCAAELDAALSAPTKPPGEGAAPTGA